MNNAGYSRTPLVKKIGIKEGFKIKVINFPDNYFKLFSLFPEKFALITEQHIKKDFIHYFAKNQADLKRDINQLSQEIVQNGIIWLSWPKKASKVDTDLDGNIVRKIGLKAGLVDIKVCAVNEVWSGLKFVIPLKNRKNN
jgi:hypothetical protein